MLRDPVFVLSLDTEFAWGTRDLKYRPHYEKKREMVSALLGLFEKYEIKATWAVVGHLFLRECKPADGKKHPEIVRPHYAWVEGDWFDIDPCTSVDMDPIWYAPDVIERIQQCYVPQEIACHTFSHVVANDSGCKVECLDSELRMCNKLAAQFGIQLRSFVFPKNEVAHLEVLCQNGFTCFRGRDAQWYSRYPRILRRVAHVIDNYFVPSSPAVRPSREGGLWNIPGSYFYPHRMSWAKWLPVSFRVRKVKKGIERAIRQNALYHLWFHPFNLASDPEGLLGGLEEILAFVDAKRRHSQLRNLTMGELASEL